MTALPVQLHISGGVIPLSKGSIITDSDIMASEISNGFIRHESIFPIHNNNNNNLIENTDEAYSAPTGNVKSFFNGTTIMVTGGSGFLGKTLLEKLLRTCEGIEKIYILLRPKRGVPVDQRHKELVKNTVFDRIRDKYPERLLKMEAVSGDVSQAKLGLSDADYKKLGEEVNIVFHSAATIRFVEPLAEALELNTIGTKRTLELCSTMKKLKSVVHVSTAYSNPDRPIIDEKIYPTTYDPETLIQCAAALPLDSLDLITPRLQGTHPNTYTLTKALGEQIVARYANILPICIVRPSIITAAISEPFPGWIDNVFGVTGIVMEISRGTIRSAVCNDSGIMDIVPVDTVVNTCIAAAWDHTHFKSKEPRVYNCTSGQLNPITWHDFAEHAVSHARVNPSKYVMMYPNFKYTKNRVANLLWEIFTHYLPSILFDLILRMQGKKPLMMKIARRIKMATMTGEFFAMRQWKFGNKNLLKMSSTLQSNGDIDELPCDVREQDWYDYIGIYLSGIRKYVLKDSMESMPAAKRKLQRLYWAQKFLQAVSGYYLIKLIFGRR